MEWQMMPKILVIDRSLTLKGEEWADLALLSTISLSRIPKCSEIHRNIIKIGLRELTQQLGEKEKKRERKGKREKWRKMENKKREKKEKDRRCRVSLEYSQLSYS